MQRGLQCLTKLERDFQRLRQNWIIPTWALDSANLSLEVILRCKEVEQTKDFVSALNKYQDCKGFPRRSWESSPLFVPVLSFKAPWEEGPKKYRTIKPEKLRKNPNQYYIFQRRCIPRKSQTAETSNWNFTVEKKKKKGCGGLAESEVWSKLYIRRDTMQACNFPTKDILKEALLCLIWNSNTQKTLNYRCKFSVCEFG